MALVNASESGVGGSPAGRQLDYVQITANVTTTTSADAIVGNAVTYDGNTRVMIEVSTPAMFITSAGTEAGLHLFEGATDLGELTAGFSGAGTAEVDFPCYGARFFTPTNGSHTYKIVLSRGTGAGTVGIVAGAGGAGNRMPAWYRITVA